ncbi:unnamed protein product [Bathycoccus prasinos]
MNVGLRRVGGGGRGGSKIHHRTVLPESRAMMHPGRFGHALMRLMVFIVVLSLAFVLYKCAEIATTKKREKRRKSLRRNFEEEDEERRGEETFDVGYEQFLKSESYGDAVKLFSSRGR